MVVTFTGMSSADLDKLRLLMLLALRYEPEVMSHVSRLASSLEASAATPEGRMASRAIDMREWRSDEAMQRCSDGHPRAACVCTSPPPPARVEHCDTRCAGCSRDPLPCILLQ